MEITLKKVSNYALKNISVIFPDNNFSVVLGQNGSGKTTLLNVIAGLTRGSGETWFGRKNVTEVPVEKRNISYIFQNYNLLPHLTVYENIVLPLKIRKQPINAARFQEIVEDLHIEHLLDKFPATLSGGERQKIAIARSMHCEPAVLLMDEPFTGLDLSTIKYLRNEVKFLQNKYELTIIFVTHNLYEAEELADTVYVLKNGQIVSNGRFEEIFYENRTEVDELFGKLNIIEVQNSTPIAEGLTKVFAGNTSFLIPNEKDNVKRLAIDPKDIYISPYLPPPPHINLKKGIIRDKQISKHFTSLTVDTEGLLLHVEIPSDIERQSSFHQGMPVYIIIKLSRIKVL